VDSYFEICDDGKEENMRNIKTRISGVFATLVFTACACVNVFAANPNNVSFETFITSVKAGEFVLSASVKDEFLTSVNSGNTDRAMEIYRDYFDGDNDDAVAYVVADVASDEAEADATEAEAEKTEEKEVKQAEAAEPEIEEDVAPAVEEEPEAIYYQDIESDDMGDVGAPDSDFHGLSDGEYTALCKMVQAEAGGEGLVGKKLVANVILNRVKSYAWPNTVCGVVSQPGQFSPFANGRFQIAIPDRETVAAVNAALDGENNAVNITYFKSVKSTQVWSNKVLAFTYGKHLFYYGN